MPEQHPPFRPTPTPPPLLREGIAALTEGLSEGAAERMWIDVIRQMDTVYADLVESQVALEDRHRELGEAHDLIDSVLESMTDIVIACGPDGRIQRVNEALLAIVGGEQAALVGQPIEALFLATERPSIAEAMEHVRAGGAVDQREWHLIARDGSPATISTNIAPRRAGAGRFAGLVFVGRPLGELQRAYHELDEAHRNLTHTQQQLLVSEKMAALGRLVAGVAHELNNPISFVFGNMYSLKRYGEAIARYLAALGEDAGDPALVELRRELRIDRILADIGPLVDGTLEGAERVRDIVQDLRRFSSNQREAPETFDVIRMVQTAADWVAKAQRTAPRFEFDMPQRLDIIGHKGQFHQILVNLIQNACDALEGQENGRIAVKCRSEGGRVIVSVCDNGGGVAPEHRDKIFEPFFTTKPIGAGTGLGLYVSYNMAAKLGGSLTFADAPGGGALFTVNLPSDAVEDEG